MRKLAAALLLSLVPLTAPAAAQEPVAPTDASARATDEAEIRARRIAYTEAIATRRPDLMAGFITENMAEMVSSGDVNKGRGPVIADYEKVEFNDPDFVGYDRHTDNVEVDPSGIVAAERGHWRAQVRDADGQLVQIGGAYQAGWIRQGGTWLIRTEAYVMITCRPKAGCL
jgi:ketosteroid isomerase-like protein